LVALLFIKARVKISEWGLNGNICRQSQIDFFQKNLEEKILIFDGLYFWFLSIRD